jgi:hypothetical protein
MRSQRESRSLSDRNGVDLRSPALDMLAARAHLFCHLADQLIGELALATGAVIPSLTAAAM